MRQFADGTVGAVIFSRDASVFQQTAEHRSIHSGWHDPKKMLRISEPVVFPSANTILRIFLLPAASCIPLCTSVYRFELIF